MQYACKKIIKTHNTLQIMWFMSEFDGLSKRPQMCVTLTDPVDHIRIQWIINTKIAQHALKVKVSESSLVLKLDTTSDIYIYVYGRRSSKAIRYTALLVESLTAIVLSVYLIP